MRGAQIGVGMDEHEIKKRRGANIQADNDGYLYEMRQVIMRNAETLDVIQRYTDKSAVGMQKLAEQSLDGIQRVTAESAGGLRRIIETGTSNVNRAAEAGESNLALAVQEGVSRIGQLAEDSVSGINRLTEESAMSVNRIVQDGLIRMETLAATEEETIQRMSQECQSGLRSCVQECLAQVNASYKKNQEAAETVEKIEAAILAHMEAIKELLKQSDDYTHKENVKVYRNVQAVVVDEVRKQMEAMKSQSEKLEEQNDALQHQNRGLRPLAIVTLVAAVVNVVLMAARILGFF